MGGVEKIILIMIQKRISVFVIFLFTGLTVLPQKIKENTISAGMAWSANTVNTVVFRKNSLCSDGRLQYIAFYDKEGFVILGKRKINSRKWDFRITNLKANIFDSHNSISIMTDGEGYLHIAWNHHVNQLHYTRSKNPGSLDLLPEMPMTGLLESSVTYPEFFSLPNGDLLFLYRDVLGMDLPWLENVTRAKIPRRLPVVLDRIEVRDLLAQLDGRDWLMASLLYGTGMRLME